MLFPRAFLLLLPLLVGCGPSLLSKNPYERHLAVGNLSSVKALGKALRDKDWRVAATACRTAIKGKVEGLALDVSDLLASKVYTDDRLEHFIRLLGELGQLNERRILPLYVGHRRASVRMQVAHALRPDKLGGPGAEPLLVRLLGDKDERVRAYVIKVLELYDSKTARIPLAVAKEDWAAAVRLGGIRELVVILKVLPKAKAKAILRAAHAAKAKGRPLLTAVLDDDKLQHLHMDAYVGFTQATPGSPIARFRQQTIKKWRQRLALITARCDSKNWPAPLSRLRAWIARPNFDFLQPVLERAKEDCRRAALKWVRRDLAKGTTQ